MKNILITGGSGFLGNELLISLIKRNIEVIAIGRTKPTLTKRNFINHKFIFLKADITDPKSLKSIRNKVGRVERIVHLAALVPKDKKEDSPLSMFKVNVEGTINILEILGNITSGFIYASTAEVYGLSKNKKPFKESFLPFPPSFYGASKLAGETYCQVFSKKNNLPCSILRFSVMYGPRDNINRAIPNFIKDCLSNSNPNVYGGKDLRDYLHISDAVELIHLAIEKNVSSVFNVGSSKNIKIIDAAKIIIKAINPILKINQIHNKKEPSHLLLDISKAKEILGFKPNIFFPDKLDEEIAWARS